MDYNTLIDNANLSITTLIENISYVISPDVDATSVVDLVGTYLETVNNLELVKQSYVQETSDCLDTAIPDLTEAVDLSLQNYTYYENRYDFLSNSSFSNALILQDTYDNYIYYEEIIALLQNNGVYENYKTQLRMAAYKAMQNESAPFGIINE